MKAMCWSRWRKRGRGRVFLISLPFVVPAQAGTQSRLAPSSLYDLWMPACAGMTRLGRIYKLCRYAAELLNRGMILDW